MPMSIELEAEFKKLAQLLQRQDGTSEQCRDLQPFAEKMGLLKAAHAISGEHASRARVSLCATEQTELDKLSQLPHSMDGLQEQLQHLRSFANRLGAYDAADLLRHMAKHRSKQMHL